MTAISDTPAQQLARIAELEMQANADFGWRDDVRWLCALARQGVEAVRQRDEARGLLTEALNALRDNGFTVWTDQSDLSKPI